MKKNLIKELTNLYTGELASILVFWFVYYLRFKDFVPQVFYPLLILSFILLQGALYWLICLLRLKGKKIKNVGKIFYILKYLNLILILLSIPVIVMSHYDNVFYAILGAFLLLFAITEWVNYFIVRLSYKNPKTLISLIRHNNLKKSKLAKEITDRFN